jgi:hypothetical protein
MKTIIHDPINKRKLGVYIKKLKKEGKIFEHGNLMFDKKSLLETRYTCDPRICLRVKNGVYHGSCCTDYSVDLTKEEENKITELLETGKKECLKKYPWVLTEKLYERNHDGSHYLRHRKNNTCALSVVKGGVILCVLDLLAKKFELNRALYKPSTCFSWPFDCMRLGDKIFVTTINGKNSSYLSQGTSGLRCVSGLEGKAAHKALASQIKHYAGEKAHKMLLKGDKKLKSVK